jgi:hypothetical protein
MKRYDGLWTCPHCGHRTVFDHLGMRYRTRQEIDEDIEKLLKPWTSKLITNVLAKLKKALRIA